MTRKDPNTRDHTNEYSDLYGVPALLERKDGRIRIESDCLGSMELKIPEISDDATRWDVGDFRMLGRILGYHNWIRQPREVVESSLRNRKSDDPTGIRYVFEADCLEHLDGIDLESKPDSFRERMLWERFSDSKSFRKSRPFPIRIQRDASTIPAETEASVDVLFSTGYLDLDGVEKRLSELRDTVREAQNTVYDLESRLVAREAYIDGLKPLTEAGETSIRALAEEASARIEAIGLHLGNRPEDTARLRILNQVSPDPDLVREIHRAVAAEFQALYPTRPLSIPSERRPTESTVRFDPSIYKLRK